jgi:hypothetical protein
MPGRGTCPRRRVATRLCVQLPGVPALHRDGVLVPGHLRRFRPRRPERRDQILAQNRLVGTMAGADILHHMRLGRLHAGRRAERCAVGISRLPGGPGIPTPDNAPLASQKAWMALLGGRARSSRLLRADHQARCLACSRPGIVSPATSPSAIDFRSRRSRLGIAVAGDCESQGSRAALLATLCAPRRSPKARSEADCRGSNGKIQLLERGSQNGFAGGPRHPACRGGSATYIDMTLEDTPWT